MRALSSGLLAVVCVVVISLGCAGSMPKEVDAEKDSIVIGRIEGYVLAKEGEMYHYYNQISPEWVIEGMELLEVKSEEVFKVKLNRNGFFSLLVPPGSYVLQQNRKGQSDYKANKVQEWDHFDVFPGKLVNMGTYKIETTKKLGSAVTNFVLLYNITHRTDSGGERETLEWFGERFPDLLDKYKDKVLDYSTVTSPRIS